MDHSHIDDDNLVERYLLGQLDEDRRGAFEDHFLDCPRCLEQLETARRLRDGLRLVAAQDTAAATVLASAGAWARLRRFLPLAAALAVAVLSLFWARSALEKAEEEALAVEERVAALEADLESARAPRLVPPSIALVATRSGDAASLVLRRDVLAPRVVLEVDLGPGPTRGELILRREEPPGAEPLWRGEATALEGRTENRARLELHLETLEPGLYALVLKEDVLEKSGEVTRRWPFSVR